MNEGKVFWITGLSGAGKTTVGTLLYESIKREKNNIVLLDGDNLREVFKSVDYTLEGRKNLGYKYAELCKMLSAQGIIVVICTICMFDEVRAWNRENIENYIEIYLEVDINELIRRDQKGLYSAATAGKRDNVMGINLDFEAPKHPDLVLDNSGEKTPEEQVEIILERYQPCLEVYSECR
ncbi:MAG: adenylyl-sulfate kinase [Lachnospiraceae bacterium]|nr:adenylyl-sulfate kinase [Lachnospiraceae bacterium]